MPQQRQAAGDRAAQVHCADLAVGLRDAYRLGETVEPAHRRPHVDARPGHGVVVRHEPTVGKCRPRFLGLAVPRDVTHRPPWTRVADVCHEGAMTQAPQATIAWSRTTTRVSS
jgi:hypothetical protein